MKSSDHFKDIGDRIVLKWILKVLDERRWTGFIWLRAGLNGGVL